MNADGHAAAAALAATLETTAAPAAPLEQTTTLPRTPDDTVYGLLDVAGVSVALPLDVLREAIPCPAQFSPLPAAAPGLLGAVALRGMVVPVVDLALCIGRPGRPGGEPAQSVVVLARHGGLMLGLRVDGVRGIARLPAGGLHAVAGAGDGLLFHGSFERDGGDGDSVVSVLDADALMRLPGVPKLRVGSAGGNSGRRDAALATRHALMLVRCGGVGLALPVGDVHATLPQMALEASSLDGVLCRGLLVHGGLRLPAVDPLALLALGRLPADAPCQSLLLRYPAGMVALLVSEVIDIVRVAPAELLPLPPLALHRPELFAATLRTADHGEHLVLAAGALAAEPRLVALSSLNTQPQAAEGRGRPGRSAGSASAAAASAGTGAKAAASGTPVITYDIGVEAATPLAQVCEVLPLPADATRVTSPHPAVIGIATCRGRSVTLLDLMRLIDPGAGASQALPGDARVLLVQCGAAFVGFVVPHLLHIEHTVWERPAAGADTGGTLGKHALAEIGPPGQRRTVQCLDLQGMARELMAA